VLQADERLEEDDVRGKAGERAQQEWPQHGRRQERVRLHLQYKRRHRTHFFAPQMRAGNTCLRVYNTCVRVSNTCVSA